MLSGFALRQSFIFNLAHFFQISESLERRSTNTMRLLESMCDIRLCASTSLYSEMMLLLSDCNCSRLLSFSCNKKLTRSLIVNMHLFMDRVFLFGQKFRFNFIPTTHISKGPKIPKILVKKFFSIPQVVTTCPGKYKEYKDDIGWLQQLSWVSNHAHCVILNIH